MRDERRGPGVLDTGVAGLGSAARGRGGDSALGACGGDTAPEASGDDSVPGVRRGDSAPSVGSTDPAVDFGVDADGVVVQVALVRGGRRLEGADCASDFRASALGDGGAWPLFSGGGKASALSVIGSV